ncbi:hypothetical protein TI39_contig4128g00028 [Zymoseptoria brevis]|uniref:Uncharacterized protein n=1 Tax=Zymoseptoria brevis TaxID=1047168 RepID=A0A0F4GCT3_9PEZI|nr:hypothetical protein TI39_contig4128g00028 [Zymoseptoria brevis]
MKFFTTTALVAAMAITNTAAAPVVADDAVAVGNLHDCDLDPAGCEGPDQVKVRREADSNDPSGSGGLTETKIKRAGGPHGCDPEDPGCEGPDKLKAKREADTDDPSGQF